MPDAKIHKLKALGLNISFREAPLTLTMLAALVPNEMNARTRLIDESVDKIPFDELFDLVGISCLTGTALRGYAIADFFRNRGIPVVLGGIHVTLCPEEALEHADSIVAGFAEKTWPQLLRDFRSGNMRKRYRSNQIDINTLPIPRRDLQRKFGYMSPNTVFATRGCKGRCDFCSVPTAGFGWHTRPIGQVIDEIKAIKSGRFVFNDVSLLEDRDYAKDLFTALIPLKKKWGGLCTTQIGADDEMLELMHKSGCIYLLLGFESVTNKSLYKINKGFNKPDTYVSLMSKLHDKNIIVQGCFIFGFDEDTTSIFEETVDAVNDLKIDIPRYAIYTPYPGTSAYTRLKNQDRLLHEKWIHYDTQHVVFKPAQMSPEELDSGFRWAFKQTFKFNSIVKRTASSGLYMPITFMGNLAYQMYVKRLQREQNNILTN